MGVQWSFLTGDQKKLRASFFDFVLQKPRLLHSRLISVCLRNFRSFSPTYTPMAARIGIEMSIPSNILVSLCKENNNPIAKLAPNPVANVKTIRASDLYMP